MVKSLSDIDLSGMLKKAASGVLALLPCSRTVSTLRASKWLGPCWTDFFDHSYRLLISILPQACMGHVSEIFKRPLSTAANDPGSVAVFPARKNPQCIPENTLPVFPDLRHCTVPRLLRLVTNGNVEQTLKYGILLFALLTLTGCISQSLFPKIGPLEETVISGKGGDKVLIVDISGLLTSSRPSGVIDQLIDRPSLPTRIKEELEKASDDSKVKAIVLRINTPGGTVTASDIVHHEILAFKDKRHIPVVASIMDLGTSGGYYVAMASDTVVAHPSAVTGSLGVIMMTMNASGLLEKVGVEAIAVTSGPQKDMGSPFRAMTAKDRAIFQSVIDSFYQQFLQVIDQGRPKLNAKTIQQLADGRIYSAQQAKELGLIDEIGYLDDAIDLAKRAAGITEARVVRYHRQGGYYPNIYAQVGSGSPGISFPSLDPLTLTTFLGGTTPAFLYLWLP